MNFFVIEGIDGSGKTTLIQLLQRFIKKIHKVQCFLFLKEPTDLETGKKIKELLLSNQKISQKDWLKLFEEDRLANVEKNILPNKEKIIIQDRYYFSTAAYQGETKEQVIEILYYFYKKFPKPKIIFFLQLDLDTALQRIQKRNANSLDIFEKKEELKRIYKNYQILLEELKKLDINFYILDSKKNSYHLAKEVLKIIFSNLA